MKLLHKAKIVTLLLSTPMLATAMPIMINQSDNETGGTETPFATSFDNPDNGRAVFSNDNTGVINFARPADATGNITKLYNTTTTENNAVSLLFGGLTRGQTVEFTPDANGDANGGPGIHAIRTSGNVAGGDFVFRNDTYTRPATADGRYGSSTPYIPGSATPVSIVQDTSITTVGGVLSGHGVARADGGFTPVDQIREGFGAITIVFGQTRVSGVAGYLGSLENPGSVQAVAYDQFGVIIETATSINNEIINNTGLDAFELIGIETAADEQIIQAITFMQVGSDELGFNLDYVVFELASATTNVAAPPALALMILGFLGLTRRRFTKG